MKHIVKALCILTVFILSATAQQNTRTLEVKGVGTYKALPDIGVLTIEATIVSPKFADAVKTLNSKTEQLIAQLQTVGFKKDEIKTTDFSVSKNMVWENNVNIDKGYIAQQNISVEFPNSNEKIGTIISSFMNSENEVRFAFHFTLSGKKEILVKNELLRLTVNDAQSRADVIVAASKQKLGKIKYISYGITQEQIPFRKNTLSVSEMAITSQRSSGFDVKEMTFTDEVTIVWELK
ncbi:MAG: SIMPL domain-containing protein [Bacteroidota bacterium]|nr:SIMPL domain-containing protein [Bacteroidota bacterium]